MAFDALSKILILGAPAAASTTAVHANFSGNNAALAFPGPITSPAVARNLTVTFAAAWDGGTVTVVGTDQFDAAISEVFTPGAGTTVTGTKMFKTVTSAAKSLVGADVAAASIGTGVKLAIPARISAAGVIFCDGVAEAGTWVTAQNSVAPTTAPNGTRVYTVIFSEINDVGGEPEGRLTAGIGAICIDHQGRLWYKKQGTGSTGWVLMPQT